MREKSLTRAGSCTSHLAKQDRAKDGFGDPSAGFVDPSPARAAASRIDFQYFDIGRHFCSVAREAA